MASESKKKLTDDIKDYANIKIKELGLGAFSDNILLKIEEEFKTYNVTKFLDSGTTKYVYDTKGGEYVVKVELLNVGDFNNNIKELIAMHNIDFCNTPSKIKVISKNDIASKPGIRESMSIDYETYSEPDIGDSCIIIWKEEKAKTTAFNYTIDLEDYYTNVELKKLKNEKDEDFYKWFKRTKGELNRRKFTDFNKGNVGIFYKPPNFRWIDIQPDPDEEVIVGMIKKKKSRKYKKRKMKSKKSRKKSKKK